MSEAVNRSEVGEQGQSSVKVIALSELREGEVPGRALVGQINPLHQVKAHLQVCVGELEMTVGELLEARENQILRLDKHVTQPIDLMLDGKVVARGELVAVGEHFGVRITDLPVSLKI